MVDIRNRALTVCNASANGRDIELQMLDIEGRDVILVLPLDQAGAIAMTLPSLIEKAIRNRYRDQSLRYTFPLMSYALECSSDPATNIIRLETLDGFKVSFSLTWSVQQQIGEAFRSSMQLRADWPN